jgi:PPK2 family polyphosphate:nucleotide phosphotransferase
MRYAEFAVPESPSKIDLATFDTRDRAGFDGKDEACEALEDDVKRLAQLHDVFAAQSSHALLIVLQGMDTAGKDGIVRHVMTGMNPQGVNVYSFRKPSDDERRHDFLWREVKVLPERGRISIFNRSYYEEVLILRVQPELLSGEAAHRSPHVWEHRYDDINAFERHLARCNTIVVKLFLHISKDEQRKRLLSRLETPTKMWKASDADLDGHARWDAYVDAYEKMLRHTSTPWAPWYVVPADRKWAARAVAGAILVDTLEALDLKYPKPSADRRKRYAQLAQQLESEHD